MNVFLIGRAPGNYITDGTILLYVPESPDLQPTIVIAAAIMSVGAPNELTDRIENEGLKVTLKIHQNRLVLWDGSPLGHELVNEGKIIHAMRRHTAEFIWENL